MTPVIIACFVLLLIITIVNVSVVRTHARQKQAFDELMMKFITSNQLFYESQKNIVKSETKNIESVQRNIKDAGNLKTDYKRLFIELVEKYNEVVRAKKLNSISNTEVNPQEKLEKIGPMVQKLRTDIRNLNDLKRNK